ncbi:MAG: cob(I)yrinic acid a,c-diamide adenosyltransferase [Proteobacteria bacterium]|nr:cob(I)yrinic acid a,c-diamide adenosyltransferase [Pseudomonadota bacterium]
MSDNDDKNKRHKHRMQRHKEVVDAGMAKATDDRGVVVVLTGNGKGKSSSAFGMAARALGHGMSIAIIQFIKGKDTTGEETFFRQFDNVHYHVMGEGFTWETQDRERDIKTAMTAWEKAEEYLTNKDIDMVILDELNIAFKMKYIPVERVIKSLQQRPAMQHVIITGRAAPDEIINAADTVSEIREIKHAYKQGVQAQKGVEM